MTVRTWNRRQWLAAAGGVSAAALSGCQMKEQPKKKSVAIEEYEPKSMLHVPETKVLRSRFPVIDVHTHLTFSPELGKEGSLVETAPPPEVLAVMDRKNIRMMVNLTGGHGAVLEQAIARWQKPYPDRFVTFTEPMYYKAVDPAYPKLQADEVAKARQSGARGMKVVKTLGLVLRENLTTGRLIKVDDARFDPMWEACGGLGMPVAIHTSDPEAFFLPIDRFNERYEELNAHPDWSFHGQDYPSDSELQQARLRVIARHPKTKFLCLHMAEAENLALVSEWMDRHPNMLVEFGARIGELGRQPRASREFFDRYQDRILFGTDAIPKGNEYPQQVFGDALYEIYYRFLETEDEYFDYAPARKPPQGRWRIYGLGLPEPILKKVYYQNAERLLRLG
jgi:predicted TIM-barrel fold metal-dependent hydrolase